MKKRTFYCYLRNGKKIVTEEKPEDFEQLGYPYQVCVSSEEAAKLAYETNLRIREWKQSEAI